MSKTQNSAIVDYIYDDIYRLTSASPTGTTQAPEAYTYDAVGNRLTSAYELTPSVNETTTYGYDDENRLTGIQTTRNSQTQQLTFAYDPFGRRIRKTVSPFGGGAGEVTNYVYDGQNIILEYDQAGTITTRYTHGPNVDEPLSIEITGATATTPYYYHADGLGSITALSNASGNIIQRYEYDSFGNQTITTNGNINQPFTFTAREYDSETGMYFYRARYYDPKAGRFVTKDPIGFDGGDVNLYAYVRNNPVNRIDPSGLIPELFGNLISDISGEIMGMGIENTIGGITGGVCASYYCKIHKSPNWHDADGFCLSYFSKHRLPSSNPNGEGFSNEYVSACSRECVRIGKTKKYKDACLDCQK